MLNEISPDLVKRRAEIGQVEPTPNKKASPVEGLAFLFG